jgi:hypothetical protein
MVMRLLGAAAPKTVEGTMAGHAAAAPTAAAPWSRKLRRLRLWFFIIDQVSLLSMIRFGPEQIVDGSLYPLGRALSTRPAVFVHRKTVEGHEKLPARGGS